MSFGRLRLSAWRYWVTRSGPAYRGRLNGALHTHTSFNDSEFVAANSQTMSGCVADASRRTRAILTRRSDLRALGAQEQSAWTNRKNPTLKVRGHRLKAVAR